MSNTQSIIVYQNPAQAAFWEGGFAFPLGAALLVLFVVVLASMKFMERVLGSWKVQTNGIYTGIAMCLGAAAAAATFAFLYIP